MEFVAGRKVTDLGPLGRLELDGAPLADQLFAAYLDQVLVDGVFHADPHPGNVLADPGRPSGAARHRHGRPARPRLRDKLVKLFLALADARPGGGHAGRAHDGRASCPTSTRPVFARAVADLVGRSADASLSDLDIGALVLQLTRKAGEAGLRMDPELVMLGKTLLNLDQVAATLDPASSRARRCSGTRPS